MITERFVRSGGLSLHCLDYDPGSFTSLPLVYVPGISGVAEDGAFFFEAFPDRRCISLSMRGRGKSDTPPAGYAIADHGADLMAVISALGLRAGQWHLHGYSIGVMYALAFVGGTDTPPKSVVLGDHPGRVGKLPLGWATNFSKLMIQGRSVLDNIRPEVLRAIECHSDTTDLYEILGSRKLDLPALLLRGGSAGQPPSPLSESDEAAYRRIFSALAIEDFGDAGHFLRDTHRERYLEAIGSFLGKNDA